jgi:hypothetical protein
MKDFRTKSKDKINATTQRRKEEKRRIKHANAKTHSISIPITPPLEGQGEVGNKCKTPTASTLLSPYLKGTSEAEGLEQR